MIENKIIHNQLKNKGKIRLSNKHTIKKVPGYSGTFEIWIPAGSLLKDCREAGMTNNYSYLISIILFTSLNPSDSSL